VSGPESGIYDDLFTASDGLIQIEKMPARFSKAYRAQKCARAWSRGLIHVLAKQRWTGPYLAEHHAFDGAEGNIDDQVDGTVAAYDAHMAGRALGEFGNTFSFGRAFGA
jgi:hypothetical protein